MALLPLFLSPFLYRIENLVDFQLCEVQSAALDEVQSEAIVPSGKIRMRKLVSRELQSKVDVPSGELQSEAKCVSGEVQNEAEVISREVQSEAEVPSGAVQSEVEVVSGEVQSEVKIVSGEVHTSFL